MNLLALVVSEIFPKKSFREGEADIDDIALSENAFAFRFRNPAGRQAC